MATQIQFRRGTKSEHSSFTGASAEITVNTTNKSLHVHDGSTAGGQELARADLSNHSGVGILTATTFSGNLTGTATTTSNIPNLSGDVTSVNTVTTLATVNSDVGTYGDGGSIPSITVNAKGLITGVTTTSINPANDGTLTLETSGTGLSGSATFTANQSGNSTFTVTSNATNENTVSTIVSRDGDGGFIAGIITATTFSGNLTGTASTATAAATSYGLSGSPNVTVGVITATSFFGDGSGLTGAGSTVSDDTTTNATFYPIFTQTTSGTVTSSNVSTTKLTFNPSTGTLTAVDVNSSSDEKLKENIRVVDNSLEKILQLNGIQFNWKETKEASIGVIAQNVERVFPELVKTAESKSVNYNGLIGVLIEAVKELKSENDLLRTEISEIKSHLNIQ